MTPLSDIELIELSQRIQPLLPQRGRIDSTVNRGRDGVGSVALDGTLVTDGYVLTATGDGGSTWEPATTTPRLPDLISSHITIGDLVAWWRMGESASPELDYAQNPLGDKDAAVNSNTAGHAHVTYDVTGGLTAGDDGACQFNYNQAAADGGDGDYFSANDTTNHRWSFGSTAVFTIECLVHPTSTWSQSGDFGIFGTNNPIVSDQGWHMGATKAGGGVTPYFTRRNNGPGAQTATSSSICPYDAWSHLAGTFDGTTQRIYLNGVLTGSSGSTVNNSSQDTVYIGKQDLFLAGLAKSRFFYGIIDEVAIYSAVLSADEILLHASAGVDIPAPMDSDSLLIYVNGS